MKVVIFIGLPGCGKDTHARILSEKTGWPVYGSGDLCRSFAARGSSLDSVRLIETLAKGELAPSSLIQEAFKARVSALNEIGAEGVIFNGFSRMPAEAFLVLQMAQELHWQLAVVFLDIPEELSRERIARRREKLSPGHRPDDTEAILENRIRLFKQETAKSLQAFDERGKLIKVNCGKFENDLDIIASAIQLTLPILIGPLTSRKRKKEDMTIGNVIL